LVRNIKHISDFFKKKYKDKITDSEFSIGLVRDLVESDVDNIRFHLPTGSITSGFNNTIDLAPLLRITTCRFKPNWFGGNNHPKLEKEKYELRNVEYSTTGFANGVSGFYLTIDAEQYVKTRLIDNHARFDIMWDIFKALNKERMDEYGIGFCLNKHHTIGDSIVLYKL
jgi:hypothetical protein